MKCYLHIGTEKTGTSTIQHFFLINRSQLAKNNFYYLKSLGSPNNRKLPLAAYNPSRRDEYTKALELIFDHQVTDFQRKIILRLRNEVKQLPPSSIIICSSEHIQSRLTTIEEISRLKKILNNVGIDDINVIVYFRNPGETANSLYSTAIKAGNTMPNVPPPSNDYFENICNHKKTVEKFTTVFGKDKLIVRLFRKDKFKNISLVHDISNIIGLDSFINDLTIPENKNESLSLLGITILRKLNESIPKFNPNGLNNQREDIVYLISKHFSEPKFVMGENLQEAYNLHFAKSNEWLRKNYFPEEEELFPAKHIATNQLTLSEESLQAITDFITEIWISRVKLLDSQWYQFEKKTDSQKILTLCKSIFYTLKRVIITFLANPKRYQ
jgi:hypothetical protein